MIDNEKAKEKEERENEANIVFHSNSTKKFNKKEIRQAASTIKKCIFVPTAKNDNGLRTQEDK